MRDFASPDADNAVPALIRKLDKCEILFILCQINYGFIVQKWKCGIVYPVKASTVRASFAVTMTPRQIARSQGQVSQ